MWSILPVCAAIVGTMLVAQGAGAKTPTLVSASPMAVARAVHTATRLADGTVLVVGGCTHARCPLGSNDGASAELYEPHARRFVPAGRLAESRNDHAAVLLRDGRVLIVGGWGEGGVIASTEIYEPALRSFSAGPTMASVRAGATATALRDGRVLVAGGFLDNRPTTASAEIFLPETGTFQAAASMTRARGGHAAVRLLDGRVFLAGGLDRGRVTSATEIFDPRTNTFERAAAMRAPRYKAAAQLLRDGRVLLIGGAADIDGRHIYRTTEIFDPRRNMVVEGPRLRSPRYKLIGAVVSLANGDVLVAGGADTVELYSARARAFRVVGRLDTMRLFLTATRIGRREVLLTGGYDARITPTMRAWLCRPPRDR